jgi:plastocyanin
VSSRDVRSRVALGIGIPVAAFAFLAALILAFSRILLAVDPAWAPVVAMLFAVTILAGCALAATVQGTRGFAFLIGILVLTIVGGGIVGALLGEYPVHGEVAEEAAGGEPAPGQEPPPPQGPAEQPPGPGGPLVVVAQGLAFDRSEIPLPPDAEVTIVLENRDPAPHNLSIYTEPGGETIFQETPQPGPTTVEYAFTSPPPGQYYFQCDVHPQMSGTVSVG